MVTPPSPLSLSSRRVFSTRRRQRNTRSRLARGVKICREGRKSREKKKGRPRDRGLIFHVAARRGTLRERRDGATNVISAMEDARPLSKGSLITSTTGSRQDAGSSILSPIRRRLSPVSLSLSAGRALHTRHNHKGPRDTSTRIDSVTSAVITNGLRHKSNEWVFYESRGDGGGVCC